MHMKPTYLYIGLVVLILSGLIIARNQALRSVPVTSVSAFDTFSQCLTNAGAKFYGAFWCPHCKDQKTLLGNSEQMPYIECSTPNQKEQTKVCADAGVTGYPTWIFADGSTLDGLQQLSDLGAKTHCPVPQT